MSDSLLVSDVLADNLIDLQVSQAQSREALGLGGGVSALTARIFKRIKLGNPQVNIGASGLNNTKARKILHFMVLLDASGSMSQERLSVVVGINDMVRELADDSNPDSGNIEMSVYTFSANDVSLMSVSTGGNIMPLANVPIKIFPVIKLSDYVTGGLTPLNKAILSASLSGSLRATALASGRGRKASTVYLVAVTDGENTLWNEHVGGQTINYANADVSQVASDLLKTEEWVFALAYAGIGDAKDIASNLGFPLYRNINGNDKSMGAHNWRAFFSFMSKKITTASQKVASGQTGSSVIAGANNQTSSPQATNLWD